MKALKTDDLSDEERDLLINIKRDDPRAFEDMLMPVSRIASMLNKRALGSGSDSMKALTEIMTIQLGKDRIGKNPEIKFLCGQEVSIDCWDKKIEDYLDWENADVVVLEENIRNNPLISEKEKDVLLGLNSQAKLSLVSILKYTTHMEGDTSDE